MPECPRYDIKYLKRNALPFLLILLALVLFAIPVDLPLYYPATCFVMFWVGFTWHIVKEARYKEPTSDGIPQQPNS